MAAPFSIDDLMTPEQAVKRWPALSLHWLREAIASADIASVKVGRRKLVTQASIEAFLAENVSGEFPCKTDCSSSTASGSNANQTGKHITGIGMTEDAAELGEQALKQQILKRPKDD